jgi:macrolide transport system ATP-binding/permease protein
LSTLIEVVDLHKTYQSGEVQVRALRGANFSVQRGEFAAIMGTSGSGKSTMMNILGCLDRPTSGRYLLEGVEVAALNEKQLANLRSRRIGFIFQSFNLLSRTSALENVELPRFYSGLSCGTGDIAAGLLNSVGLAGQKSKYPNQLSGGQQQRVAVARALVNHPDILLADEPTGNLDSVNSTEIMALLATLNRDQGLTVILVTHDPEVAAYADRVITFRDGLIISDRKNGASGIPVKSSRPAVPDSQMADRSHHPTGWRLRPFVSMALGTALRALHRNKMRSALTVLGIFIGVAAVIAMIAVGDGARASVKQKLQNLGTNLLVILPGATTTNGVRAGIGSRSTLTVADAIAIQDEGRGIESVSYIDRQVAQVISGNRNWNTGIDGTTPSYLSIRDWQIASGRPFTNQEVLDAAPVCLLGQTVVNNLFEPGQNPVGSVVRVRGFPLRVIGVLTTKGQSNYGHDLDDVVLIPFPTAERKVLGVAAPNPAVPTSTGALNPSAASAAPISPTLNYNAIYNSAFVNPYANLLGNPFGNPPKILGLVNLIYAKAASEDQVELVQAKITDILRRRHHIISGQEDDFTVRNLNEIAQASESASNVMALLLAAVASISLLVGGIGIMNIMLVSVTERTREIGIRMAVGARRFHILLQFLLEAVLLSVFAGLVGVGLGLFTSHLISTFAGWPTLVSPTAVAGGFLFSAAVGVFFGYYPARKASMLDPIDALRYE